jgi:hypothetical protein
LRLPYRIEYKDLQTGMIFPLVTIRAIVSIYKNGEYVGTLHSCKDYYYDSNRT